MGGQVGYVVPVDAVTPREAVELAGLAEAAGFRGIMAADTFQPESHGSTEEVPRGGLVAGDPDVGRTAA